MLLSRDKPHGRKWHSQMKSPDKTSSVFNRRSALMALVAAAAGVSLYRLTLVAPHYPGGSLTVAEAHKRAVGGSLILIDIRRPDEWKQTGIPQSAHPIDMRRDDFLQALMAIAGPDRARPIAVICARGVRSARLSLQLTKAGFSAVLDVPEGMLGSGAGPGWLATGLPTEIYTESSE